MVGKKVVHHLMMSSKDCHYVGGLVNGARILNQWGDVGTELMVYVDGDISLFLGYEDIKFTAPVYEGDFMEYTGEIIEAARDYDPARITRYCMDLAGLFHKFYNSCRVKGEEEPLMQARLALCEATRTTLRNALSLLKITAPETM